MLSWDFTKPEVKWFEGAQLNITENCLDRHLITRANKTAIIFEPNHPNEKAQHITYAALYEQVCKMANVLKAKGVQKGDRVCIYLPMIPELTVAILACARIGAVHSVVFAGFSATALATRINDCNCKMMITSDGSFRGAKTLNLKQIVDDALVNCKDLETVLVVKRTGEEVQMETERDFWLFVLRKLWLQKTPYLYFIRLALPANQKGCYIPLQDIWFIPHIHLKMCFNMKKMMCIGVPQM